MSSFFDKSALEIGNSVLRLLIEIFSYLRNNNSSFKQEAEEIFMNFIIKNNIDINNSSGNINFDFETKRFYIKILYQLNKIVNGDIKIKFNSYYSLLLVLKINNFLDIILSKNNKNVIDNPKVKIYLYLLFLHTTGEKKIVEKLGLNEGFFLGTYKELMQEYPGYEYKDSKYIKDVINKWKKKIKISLRYYFLNIFKKILEYLKNYGKEDDLIKRMKKDADIIYYELEKNNLKGIEDDLKKFYDNQDYLIILNYISEMFYNNDTIKEPIDSVLLNKIKSKYCDIKIDDNLNLEFDRDKYEEYQTTIKVRMLLSYPKLIYDIGLDNEILICTLMQKNSENPYNSIENYKVMENINNNIENLDNTKVEEYVKKILDDNEFYKTFFSILESNLIKTFFCGNLYIEENETGVNILDSKIEGSECFEYAYKNFLKKYNKQNFEDFKNLIIIKTLSKGTRACILTELNKYIINARQLYIGADINEQNSELKEILEGYLIVILLQETEQFLRLLDEGNNKNVRISTPKSKEGGRLFIKYIFGVESISRISQEQAKIILNLDNWKDHKKIKSIFEGQLEEANVNEYYSKIYPKSISFYSTRKNINETTKDNSYMPFKY